MRVLALRRQKFGAARTLLDALVEPLLTEGIDLVIDDADEWIPDKTGFGTDREVSKLVKKAAQGFDLVHAWGYRTAWACSEAFYLRFPWLYTAYDMPKTTHSDLIDRLNASHRGVCSSHAVKSALDEADTLNLEVLVPGVPLRDPAVAQMDRQDARARIGVRDDVQLVVGLGAFTADHALEALVDAFDKVRAELPGTRLLLSGAGPNPPPIHQEAIDVRGPQASVWPLICAADLVVVPSRRAGFSLVAAESMMAGIPVLFRKAGGLCDMAEDGINGFFFSEDDGLGAAVVEALTTDMTRDSVARAGQLRAQARFGFDRYARETAHLYREVAGA